MAAAPARTCAVKRARRTASTARAGSSAGQGAPHSGACAAAWRARQRALQYRGRAHAAQASRAGGRGHRHSQHVWSHTRCLGQHVGTPEPAAHTACRPAQETPDMRYGWALVGKIG